jgi:hypothetical protein
VTKDRANKALIQIADLSFQLGHFDWQQSQLDLRGGREGRGRANTRDKSSSSELHLWVSGRMGFEFVAAGRVARFAAKTDLLSFCLDGWIEVRGVRQSIFRTHP